MSSIAQQWTGKGLAAGTALVSGNVNTAGNGSNVSYGSTGTAEIITEGNGFRIRNTEDGSIRRLDTTTTGTGVRAQIVLTVGSAATGTSTITQLRNASTAVADVVVSTDNRIYIGGIAPVSPTFSFGDKLLVDVVHTLHSSPTTSNGRSFIRVRNLTNAAWNTNGEWFYDSGYSTNRGTTLLRLVLVNSQQINLRAPASFMSSWVGRRSQLTQVTPLRRKRQLTLQMHRAKVHLYRLRQD
jgi:hypothetical protein